MAAFAEVFTSELIGIVYALLPGFVAAWVFYGLTAHPRKSPFERTIQALIFTGIAKVCVSILAWAAIKTGGFILGRWPNCPLGAWTPEVEFGWSVTCGGLVGLLFSFCANTGIVHKRLQAWGITSRTPHPSEWYSTLSQLGQAGRFVYLHLRDGRRIYGWPFEWPDQPDRGHFALMRPEWILTDNQHVPLLLTEKLLVPARMVRMVEIEKPAAEWPSLEENRKIEDRTTKLWDNEPTKDDGTSVRNTANELPTESPKELVNGHNRTTG